ncbi:hypothetical protein [Streptomyces sp. NBC_00280]|uniref:hypothetical protein n=1 Tax=Streptomyces sp. NBC_00280 TaxID=2975699 RepID=UPI00325091BA
MPWVVAISLPSVPMALRSPIFPARSRTVARVALAMSAAQMTRRIVVSSRNG